METKPKDEKRRGVLPQSPNGRYLSDQEWLSKIYVEQAHEYIRQHHFVKGSKFPKMEVGIRFATFGEG